MGGRYKPPNQVPGVRVQESLEIQVKRQEVTFPES